MDLGLKDKVILVTGGAKGIGLGIAQVLAKEGAIPVIVGRNEADNTAALTNREHAVEALTQHCGEYRFATSCGPTDSNHQSFHCIVL